MCERPQRFTNAVQNACLQQATYHFLNSEHFKFQYINACSNKNIYGNKWEKIILIIRIKSNNLPYQNKSDHTPPKL